MIDHIGFAVADYERSKDFFVKSLAPLGLRIVMEGEGGVGIGVNGKPFIWLAPDGDAPAPIHVAFTAESRADVDAFHRAALAAGGKDNGAPGLRPHYHPNYYGAFVISPEGHNVEAVCHKPER